MEEIAKWILDKSGGAVVGALLTAAINGVYGWIFEHQNWAAVIISLIVAIVFAILVIYFARKPVGAPIADTPDHVRKLADLEQKVSGVLSWLARAGISERLDSHEIRIGKFRTPDIPPSKRVRFDHLG